MLFNHVLKYAFSLGLPALINLAGIYLFTRLLTPDSYGEYSIVVASAALVNSILFRWISLGLLRFYNEKKNQIEILLSTIIVCFFIVLVISSSIAIFSTFFIVELRIQRLIFYCVFLLWAYAFFELNRELVRCQFKPFLFGVMGTIRATCTLLIGGILAYLGFGTDGILVGVIFGLFLSVIVTLKEWKNLHFKSLDINLFKNLLHYGLPLSITASMAFIVSSSDRFLLGWLIDKEAAGLYSVGYDLAQSTLNLPMMIVNLAALPFALKNIDEESRNEVNIHLKNNITLLIAISVPSAACLAILAPNIANVFVGVEFRNSAAEIIPLVSLGAFFAGIKSYYTDLSFQLSKKTFHQIWITLICASINVSLNLVFIPKYGYIAAAYSTVVTYMFGLIISAVIGRRIFYLPFPAIDTIKVFFTTILLALILFYCRNYFGILSLFIQLLTGSIFCLSMYFYLNLFNLRVKFKRKFLS